MPSPIRKSITAAVAAIVLSVLSGWSEVAAQSKLTFVMPSPPAPYLLPYFIAKDSGAYGKAGLEIEEKIVTGDTNSLRALISGEADITYVGPGTIMQAYVAGARLRIIGSFQPIVDYRIVARPDAGADLKELSTKRWASSSTGGMVQALPQLSMRKHGLDDKRAQFLAVGGHSARYQAVVAGIVDATLVDTATMVRGVRDGKVRLVRSITDDFPDMGYVYLVVREIALTTPQKRQALEIFIREGIRGARVIVDHPREAAEVMEKRAKSDDVDTMTETLKGITQLNVWGINGGLQRSVYDFSEKTLRDMSVVTGPAPYETLVDTSLVDSALMQLGRR